MKRLSCVVDDRPDSSSKTDTLGLWRERFRNPNRTGRWRDVRQQIVPTVTMANQVLPGGNGGTRCQLTREQLLNRESRCSWISQRPLIWLAFHCDTFEESLK